jgi:hypothetical protein
MIPDSTTIKMVLEIGNGGERDEVQRNDRAIKRNQKWQLMEEGYLKEERLMPIRAVRKSHPH